MSSEQADPEEIVTLTRFGELTAAQLLCGRLDAEGIECFIPDEVMAAQTWHLNCAIGGIRVQVRRADLERARQILTEPGKTTVTGFETEDETGAIGIEDSNDDGTISVGDRAAFRSLRVALVSLWLLGLIHPYSLWLAVRTLQRNDLTGWGRRRAWITFAISLAGCTSLGYFVYRFAMYPRG